jgi:hypothetical protein
VSDIEITIKLPEELVERAKAVGIQIEEQIEQIAAVLETQIRRREAGQRLRDTMAAIDALPDDIKPTPEEIEAEIRAYWAERTAKNSTGNA